jgi:hypothetical protein
LFTDKCMDLVRVVPDADVDANGVAVMIELTVEGGLKLQLAYKYCL